MNITCDKKSDILPPLSEILENDGTVCPVDWAKRCALKAHEEACGKCVMCRDGSTQLSLILEDITNGKGKIEDLDLIEELCNVIKETASCEMARTMAFNISESLKQNRQEWELHITRKRCTALICKGCYSIVIQPELCNGCDLCTSKCPEKAIEGTKGLIHIIDEEKCTKCGVCLEECPSQAAVKYSIQKPRIPETPVPCGSWTGTRRRHRKLQIN